MWRPRNPVPPNTVTIRPVMAGDPLVISACGRLLGDPFFNEIVPMRLSGALVTGDQRREPHLDQLAGPHLMVVAFLDHDELLLVLHPDG